MDAKGRVFHWGGAVVEVRNYADRSVMVVLAYPLDPSGRPDMTQAPVGRFLADRDGFVEPLAYPEGTLVSISGPLIGYHDGLVGERSYQFPALQLQQLRQWPAAAPARRAPIWSIGVSGGSYGGGVGVGVTF
jgi:outer membrane lipoprotein